MVPLLLFTLASLSSSQAAAGLPYHYNNPGHFDINTFEPQHQTAAHKLLTKVVATALPENTHTVTPLSYNADPTGVRDSTQALQTAVNALLAFGTEKDAQGRLILGGAVLDLQGGVYSVSQSIIFPAGYSSFSIRAGSIVARSNFTSAASGTYLLQIGALGHCKSSSGGSSNKNCNSDVNIAEVTLDGSNVAFGCLSVWDTMNINLGTLYVVGYQGVGISLEGSGAGFIHETWLGQFQPGDKGPAYVPTATGILLSSGQHDCDLNNIIIFSGLVGVNTTNGANRLQGVHTWNLAGNRGGTGIRLHKGSGRVQQCYLDYAPLVVGVTNYATKKGKSMRNDIAVIEGNLFLGSSTMVLEAGYPNTLLSDLVVTGNLFHSRNAINATVTLDESNGNTFVMVENVVMENNQVGQSVDQGHQKLSTRATDSVSVPPGSKNATIDFTQPLVFDASVGIDPLSVVCSLRGQFPTALSTSVKGNVVTVHLAEEVPNGVMYCSVTCTVDQSRRTSPAH